MNNDEFGRASTETKGVALAETSPVLDEEQEDDRDAARGRSRALLRRDLPGLDAERHLELDGGAEDVDAIASEGLDGSPGVLPHREAIQQSFGEHEVSNVEAYVGGPAAKAAGSLGADAYETDGKVAFASPPDLHTAAHEAAHVVQQRSSGGGEQVVAAAGGALSSPADAAEVHADAVADRVVRGESAASLLSRSPAPGQPISLKAKKPAKVKAPDDPQSAWVELEKQLDGAITTPARIPLLVTMLPYDKLAKVQERLDVIEAACTARQVLAVCDALELAGSEKIASALRAGATSRDLAPYLRALTDEELVVLAQDATLLASLRSVLPGRASVHLPHLRFPWGDIVTSGPLMRWLVESSSPLQIWDTIRGSMAKAEIAKILDQESLWVWTSSLSSSALADWENKPLREYAALTKVAAVKGGLETLAAAGPQPVAPLPEDASEADQNQRTQERLDAGRSVTSDLTTKLLSGDPLSASELLETAHRSAGQGAAIGKSGAHRAKVSAVLTPDEMLSFTDALGFSVSAKLDWLLATTGVEAAHFLAFLPFLGDAELDAVFASDKHVAAMRKVLDPVTSPLSLMNWSAKLQQIALRKSAVLDWMLGDGTPSDLLNFATLGTTAESIASACKAIEPRFGYGWVYDLDSHRAGMELRRLALAIPDRAAKTFIETYLLRDDTTIGIVEGGEAIDATHYESAEGRVRDAAASDDMSNVATDVGEMNDAERAAITSDPALLARVLGQLDYRDASRVAQKLGVELSTMLRAVAANVGQIEPTAFRAYVRGRPAAEQVAVSANADLAGHVQAIAKASPFLVLASLQDPDSLATALRGNPSLLDWIETTVNPVEAIERLGASPLVARVSARAFEAQGTDLIDALPAGKLLSASQKAALMRIGSEATKGELHGAVSECLTSDVDDRGGDQHAEAVNGTETLADALDGMSAGRDARDIQALCNTRPRSEALALLTEPKLAGQLKLLQQALYLSPLTVFPWLSEQLPDGLFANPVAVDWLLTMEDAVVILGLAVASPRALAGIAAAINARRSAATVWLVRLDGTGFRDAEERALRGMFDAVSTDAASTAIFKARFGMAVEGAWTRDDLARMWRTMAALPDAQVEANPDFAMVERSDKTQYDDDRGAVMMGESEDEVRYEKSQWQPRKDLAVTLGVTEDEVESRVGDRIEKQEGKRESLYRIKPVPTTGFTSSALHEIGHAVDQMIGGRTELVYDLAGWKKYGEQEFETWVSDMGGWAGASIEKEEREEISDVFHHRMNSDKSIQGPPGSMADMVPKAHPLRKAGNQGAFLVKSATSRPKPFHYKDPVVHGGRLWVLNNYYQHYFSCDAKVLGIVPLPYSLFAPEEFFAECYVEYYRDYDGTVDTEDRKGGNLPMWIKQWFDAHIDRIGREPKH